MSANETFDQFNYLHDQIHVPHHGKSPETQEITIPGMEPVLDVELSDQKSFKRELELINRQLGKSLTAVSVPGVASSISTSFRGTTIYGTQIISGEGLLGGWLLTAVGAAAAINGYLFDGNDANGNFMAPIPMPNTALVTPGVWPPSPIRFHNGLWLGLAGTTTDFAFLRGAFYIVQE